MYCPGCGYQAAEGKVRFCPGCGFRLDGVTELLARAGEPVGREPETPASLSQRQSGLRLGVKLILLSVVLCPVFLGLSFLFDSPVPLFPPVTLFLAGLAWALYSHLFGEDGLSPKQAQIPARPRELALPVHQSVPNTGFIPKQSQAPAILNPPSVTERTTNLLKDE
jgi:hypothetical protein